MINIEEKPLLFIYTEKGFDHIVLPQQENNIITITSCSNGVCITTNEDREIVSQKLNQYIGRRVLGLVKENNTEEKLYNFEFVEAKLWSGKYGEDVIYLHTK